MHVHWENKKRRSRHVNPRIDEWYELGIAKRGRVES